MADTSPQLFKRVYRLSAYTTSSPSSAEEFKVEIKEQIVGIIIKEMQIEFDIDRNLKKSPNQCSIKITNLNEESRTAFKELDLYVVLEAGYEDNYSVLFSGDVTYAMSEHDDTEWVTHLECGDGDRLIAGARIARSYKPGSSIRGIVNDVYAGLGQRVPESIASDSAFDKELPRGYTAFGDVRRVLTQVLKPLGFSWSVQDGQVQILSPESTTNQIFVLSQSNAMIGSPEFGQPPRTTKKGKRKNPTVTVKCLLFPQLRPGGIIELQSKEISGQFKLLSVKHKGSFVGNEWTTEMEINPLGEATTRTNSLGGNPARPVQR